MLNNLEFVAEAAGEPRIFFEDKDQIGRVTDQVISIFESEKMTYADTYASIHCADTQVQTGTSSFIRSDFDAGNGSH